MPNRLSAVACVGEPARIAVLRGLCPQAAGKPDPHRRGHQRQLQHNLQLATRLGAEVVQLEGVDIAETLVNFASERNVRHAIFGKSRLSPLRSPAARLVPAGFPV